VAGVDAGVDAGLDGAVGVTGVDAADADDVPTELVAVTVKVYAVPFVSPLTVHVVAGATAVHVLPPGDADTV
jgi:hypothetical protein